MSGEWFADEGFWRIFGDCMFRPDRFEAAAEEVDAILSLAGVPTRRVLDLGCGPGRHAVPLAERGLAVTAVDLSENLLERGRVRAEDAGVTVDWVCEDMRRFERPQSFELIVSLWTSFGYFDDPDDDLAVLRHCRENLVDGGALVLDVVGKEYVCRHLEPVHLTEFDDGALLIERPQLEANMTRYANQWVLVRDDAIYRAEWHHNLYSGQELEDRLRAAGFDDVALYGSLTGDDYDLDAERLVAVAWAGPEAAPTPAP